MKKPYSMDRNLLHISFEAGAMEDPWYDATTPADTDMCVLSVSPEARRIFARLEWLPPGGHVPHRRLQAATAHHGAFKAPLRMTGISGDFARAKIRRAPEDANFFSTSQTDSPVYCPP